MGAHKATWAPMCCADNCLLRAQYHVYDRYGQRISGEWCQEHADASVAHLDQYEEQLRRFDRPAPSEGSGS